jgi:hypothetical protein
VRRGAPVSNGAALSWGRPLIGAVQTKTTWKDNRLVSKIVVIPAKAGTHSATSACGWMGSRFHENEGFEMNHLILGIA